MIAYIIFICKLLWIKSSAKLLNVYMKVKIIKKRFAQHSNVSQVEDLFIYLSESVSVMSNTKINIRKCTLLI